MKSLLNRLTSRPTIRPRSRTRRAAPRIQQLESRRLLAGPDDGEWRAQEPVDPNLVEVGAMKPGEKVVEETETPDRLQDLQVTIEVRFITLSDNFFERIGVDFDFDIDDNGGLSPDDVGNLINNITDDDGPGVVVGLDPSGNPTADLDISFDAGGFGSSVPSFGGFDPSSESNFGFAILSDIEIFYFIQAAQGNDRAKIEQAPTVTMFNGQSASIGDNADRPFVTSVQPVVG